MHCLRGIHYGKKTVVAIGNKHAYRDVYLGRELFVLEETAILNEGHLKKQELVQGTHVAYFPYPIVLILIENMIKNDKNREKMRKISKNQAFSAKNGQYLRQSSLGLGAGIRVILKYAIRALINI